MTDRNNDNDVDGKNIISDILKLRERIDSIDKQIRVHISTRELFEPNKINLTKLIDKVKERCDSSSISLRCMKDPITLISDWVMYLFDGQIVERDYELVHLIIQRLRMASEIAETKIRISPAILKCNNKHEIMVRVRKCITSSEYKETNISFFQLMHNKIFDKIQEWPKVMASGHNLIMFFVAVIYPLTEREEVEYICETYYSVEFRKEHEYTVY